LDVLFCGADAATAAALIGRDTARDVRRVALGESIAEETLGGIFDRAASERWLLCFDATDALFGPHNEKDRSANQQVAYLLQRIEEFPGVVVILASDLRSHIDEEFARRFQSTVLFPGQPKAD
jgi:SpoVK/Ycf46/Vps4 family AAA+-type ATPase